MSSVLSYDAILLHNFGQASICLDACFILAFLDSNDPRGDNAAKVLEKWFRDGISKIGIANDVYSEVVHNLLKNEIGKAVVAAKKVHQNSQKEIKKKHILTLEESQLGRLDVSKRLLNYSPQDIVQNLLKGRRATLPVTQIIKDYKKNYPLLRSELTIFYENSLKKAQEFVQTLTDKFKFEVNFLYSDEDIKNIADSYIKFFQLEIFDAMHLANSHYNGYDYFATLDSDFVHNLYSKASLSSRILSIA